MMWCHDKCVGLDKDEPIGLWLCPSCRDTPHVLKNDVTCLKNDVKSIKECTESILTAINGLSTKLEDCVGELHDRITALSKQMHTKDTSMSDKIEQLTDTTNTIKSTVEQKASQILNKTKAVFDKVKAQAVDVKNPNRLSKPLPSNSDRQSNDRSKSGESAQTSENQSKEPTRKTMKPKYKNVQRNKAPAANQDNQRREVQTESNQTIHNETIDLTLDNKKQITQSTLLVGSSILKGVRVQDLKPDTTVRSFFGARVNTIGEKTLILHVGGNDADSGVDLDSFYENYVSLLNDLSAENRHIIVSGFTPRESVDVK